MDSGIPADIQAARDLFLQQLAMFQHPTPLYNVACCEALLGNSKTALEFLQKAVTAGYSNATHMEADADLRSLREFPEFKALVASLKPSEPSSSSSTSSVQIPITTTAPTPSATNSTSNSAAIPNHVPTDPTPPPAPSPVFVPTPSVSAPTPAPASPTAVTADLENEKMKHLESMGFVDRQKNVEVLARTNGNINVAVAMLLQQNQPPSNWFNGWQ